MEPIYHVLNAAVMPREGRYSLRQITAKEFFELIVENSPRIISHIGYEANIKLIENETLPPMHLNLLKAKDPNPVINDGDKMLIMRLKRTDQIPQNIQSYHFDFFAGEFFEH